MAEWRVQCYAHENPDGIWEAICVDLDIAVEGGSLREVRELLETAIETYLQDAAQLPAEQRERLLNRRSPLHVRARYAMSSALNRWFGRPDNSRDASFVVSCPA